MKIRENYINLSKRKEMLTISEKHYDDDDEEGLLGHGILVDEDALRGCGTCE